MLSVLKVRVIYVNTSQMTGDSLLVVMRKSDKPNNERKGLKHVGTHEYVDQSLVDAVD